MQKKFSLSGFLSKNMAWVILLVVVIIFSIVSPGFLTIANIINILGQNAYVVIASLGVAFLMMSGEFDISVGYMMSLCVVGAGILMVQKGVPTVIAVIMILILGMLLSMLNNFLCDLLKITRFMITVATMAIYQGASYVVSKSVSISGFPESFKAIGQTKIGIVAIPIIIMLILLVICEILMTKTYFGQYVYALGGNQDAAKIAGIDVRKMKYIISALAGFLIALAALILTSRLGAAHSTTGPGTEFTAITGILLGGVSVRGGEGKMSSVFAGVLIVSILANGMQLAGMDAYYQFIAKGVIMLIAIGIDVYNLNLRQKVKADK